MRIFLAVRHSINPTYFYGSLWCENFYPALRALGCEIIESQTDLLPCSRFMDVDAAFTKEELEARARVSEQILEEVRSAQKTGSVDLFLSYFYNSHFDPSGFDELRRMGISSVNFYCNSIYQFKFVSAIAPKVDYSWHTEREARHSYLAAGANPVWVQLGADPLIYRPFADAARSSKACFVGQRYADRDRWLAALLDANVTVDIFGSGWGSNDEVLESKREDAMQVHLGRRHPRAGSAAAYWRVISQAIESQGVLQGILRLNQQRTHRQISRALDSKLQTASRGRAGNVALTFAKYEVVLNLSNVWADGRPGSKLIPHVRLRDFEAPMARSCYLTGYTDELSEFYEGGKEIEFYNSTDELVDKTRFYLANPDAAERLREAGYHRALRDHTWVSRFAELFRKIGFSAC